MRAMPSVSVRVYSYDQQADGPTIALTRDRFTQQVLNAYISSWLAAPAAVSPYNLQSPTFDLQSYIDKYSEQTTADPLQDIRKYFTASGSGGTTYGGIPTGSSILAYRPKKLQVNTAAVAAIGEGLAGWYLEDIEGLTCIVRPSGVSPDLIFEEPGTGRYALVEVKTRLEGTAGKMRTQMNEGVFTVLDVLAKTKLIRKGLYLAYAMVVVIYDADNFEIHRLRIEEV